MLVISTHTIWRQECEYFLPVDRISLLGEFFCTCMLASSQKKHRSRMGEQEIGTWVQADVAVRGQAFIPDSSNKLDPKVR